MGFKGHYLAGFTTFIPRLLGVILAMGIVTGSKAFAGQTTSEQALTVAFLYNFLKFAEWPEGTATNELTFCVTDSATFGDELDTVTGHRVQGKSVRIKRIELGESPRECQLLFLPQEEKPVRIREWLKSTENTPVLMVSNMSEFLDMGGMIVLINDGTRLLFEVSLEPVKRVGLKLNAQLLKVARDVRGK
jgi:YfiR/HmsC-like